jgi:hypothetical protein
MSEESDSNILLEKLEKHLGSKFPYLFLDFNEAGVNYVLLLEYLRSIKPLYGEYSEMTPYIDAGLNALDSAGLSASSIGGKTRTAFLTKRVAITQMGNIIETPGKKGGLLDGMGDLFGGNKQRNDNQLPRG